MQVPEGSILGLILFLFHINDLLHTVICKIRIFAHDTTLLWDVEATWPTFELKSSVMDAVAWDKK